MSEWFSALPQLATSIVSKIVLAAIVFFVGRAIIKLIIKLLDKGKLMNRTDPTVRGFIMNGIKIGLYVILIIAIIGILGVPIASLITVLATAGLAVGLALQGALSNLAGGIMILIFKPFKVGDYVETSGVDGVVQSVTLFYTVLLTLDNKKVTVPNGTLMNATVTDYSSEELRRVDLTFSCAKSEQPAKIQDIMMYAMNANEKVLKSPEPFARLSGGTNEAMEFTVRAWCKNEDYWDVYFDLTQTITEEFGRLGVKAPSVRIVADT